MLRNYLVVAVRNLLRYKVYSLINVAGLSIGMGCCILAVAFIRSELSWDRSHQDADRIYRVLRLMPSEGLAEAMTSGPVGRTLKAEYPEVEDAFRLLRLRVWVRAGKEVYPEYFCVTEPSIFKVLTLPLLRGDPNTVFQDPYSVVVTEATAKKHFGGNDPIGKTITVESRVVGGEYTITGVMRDLPRNSSAPIRFSFLTNTRSHEEALRDWDKWYGLVGTLEFSTFVMLRSGADADGLTEKFPEFVRRHMGDDVAAKVTYALQPLEDIHLHSASRYGLKWSEGDIEALYQLGGIGLLVLVVSCINYVNLSTARAATRQREIGVRKTAGAARWQLFGQFSLEAAVLVSISTGLGLGLADLALPAFRHLGGAGLPEDLDLFLVAAPYLPFLIVGVALLSGAYPAVILSWQDPVRVLKPGSRSDSRGGVLRKGLVLAQFVACVLLIVSTLVMNEQTRFMRHRSLGFDQDQVVTMPIFSQDRARKPDWGDHLSYRYEALKESVLRHPGIVKASAYRWPPGTHGGIVRVIETEGRKIRIPVIEGDEDFLDLFSIPIVAGRNFNPAALYSQPGEFLLNESAVKHLGWSQPIGKSFNLRDKGNPWDATIVGVVKDFHTQRLSVAVGPVAIIYRADLLSHLGVKVKSENVEEAIAFLEATWKRYLPERPFRYAFLDDRIDRLYQREEQTTQLVGAFSVLALFLGSLGLFGLASFAVERRRREIGIRKALGAAVTGIVYGLTRESGLMVLAANLVAWPVGFYLMTEWLNRFAYRIDLHLGYFAVSGAIAVLVALATVSYHALRAATSNPVDALRYE